MKKICSFCGSDVLHPKTSKIDFTSLVIYRHFKFGGISTRCIGFICSKCQSNLYYLSTEKKGLKNA